MGEKTLEQLDEAIAGIKERLAAQINELVEVIVNDLPDYVLKAVRRAFIEDVEFSESKSDADLAGFKARVSAFGKELAVNMKSSLLNDMEDWWGQSISTENAGKTLDGNPVIRKKLDVIHERILEFLTQEGLRKVDVYYKTPARFIDGKYPPGMIEKYWSQLAALRCSEEERAELDLEARKARLAQRWDNL